MWVTAGVPGSAVADPVPAGGRALAGPAVAERPRADPAPAGVPPSLSGPFAPAPPAPRAPLASVLGRRRNRWLVEWALVLLVAVGVAFGVRTFVVQTFFIPSASMEPTLMIGDRILVDKVSYRLHGVHRGDIVVFGKPPRENAGPDVKDLVKRVIGLPGDHISSQGGRVWIDGKPLAEPWLVPGTITTGITPLTVPANEYFVMGDNRSDSQDSRYFGPISRSLIVGRVVVRIWPLSKLHVF
jgi:signal peptidase I